MPTENLTSITDRRCLLLSSNDFSGLMREILEKGGSLRFRATGLSMSPFIKHGDVITVSAPGRKKIDMGTVIAFTHKSMEATRIAPRPDARIRPAENGADAPLIVHRICRFLENGAIVAKGDNAVKGNREFLESQHIIGMVTKIERNGRPIRYPIGPARVVIALVSRAGLLRPGVAALRGIKNRLLLRKASCHP